jgi:putative PIN family toxin of toxin-antitoxin system
VSQNWKVVFDTSTLVSAALREGSIPERAFKKAISSCFLCVSNETLEELKVVLARARVDKNVSQASRNTFFELVRQRAGLIVVNDFEMRMIDPKCRDAKDDKFLALAKAAGADVIVSSDEDLLVLDPWRRIRILRPTEFVD